MANNAAFITKAKAKEFSFMVKAGPRHLDFHAVFKDTPRPRPGLRTNVLAYLHVHVQPQISSVKLTFVMFYSFFCKLFVERDIYRSI